MSRVSLETVGRAPKAVLHDHLDGGLRPATVVELAAAHGYEDLPATDVDRLAAWFRRGGKGNDLAEYLATFAHTVGVMQHREAVERVAAECAQDLAADGVVYAEVRFAPELHVAAGLGLDEVVEAVLAGFDRGASGTDLSIHTIVTAMRTGTRSREIAELAVRRRDDGVVGFDLAGAEAGYPPTDHLDAFRLVRDAGLPATVHAGEGAGLDSIRAAVGRCGAARIGHGVRIVEDVELHPDGSATLGPLATAVREGGIPLETCPTSNVDTGIVPSVPAHPVELLRKLGFAVTINTDNRLMSATSMTAELAAGVEAFGWRLRHLRELTVAAVEAGFAPPAVRRRVVDELVHPGYDALESTEGGRVGGPGSFGPGRPAVSGDDATEQEARR